MPYKDELSFHVIDNLPEQLVKEGLVTKEQYAVAQVTHKSLGGDIGHILIKKGFVSESQILQFIADKLSIPFISLKDKIISPDAVKIVPIAVVQKYHLMPIEKQGSVLTVAMGDPLDLFALDEIKAIVKHDIDPVFTSKEEIDGAVRMHYRVQEGSISAMDETVEIVDYGWDGEVDGSENLEELASGTKVVSITNGIVVKAYNENASDIHIEPQQTSLRVRYRVDGLLEERLNLPKKMHLPIISRLKIMGGMDIAERRVPQDGRVRLRLVGNQVDLRLSSYPTMHGEKMVIRILIKESVIGLEGLGFSESERDKFTDIITKPHGIFLVTGPTGSGKTTTLYAALQKLNSQEKNIVSVEDPIENEIVGVSQAQVNTKAGLTFASALRSILRQDPDIIMLGEIRDRETADIAVRSAMTGHLVFSTLHTNTAIGAVMRLSDLGVEPFLVSSALLGVLSQRLVRKVCSKCKKEITPSEEQIKYLTKLGAFDKKSSAKNVVLYQGKGCKECRMSGYKGRTAIFELLAVNEKFKKLISAGVSEDELRKEARAAGIRDIQEDGIAKMLAGVTTLEEIIRVTQDD